MARKPECFHARPSEDFGENALELPRFSWTHHDYRVRRPTMPRGRPSNGRGFWQGFRAASLLRSSPGRAGHGVRVVSADNPQLGR